MNTDIGIYALRMIQYLLDGAIINYCLATAVVLLIVGALLNIYFRAKTSRCARCNYSIVDQSTQRCPECGNDLSDYGTLIPGDSLGIHLKFRRAALLILFVVISLVVGFSCKNKYQIESSTCIMTTNLGYNHVNSVESSEFQSGNMRTKSLSSVASASQFQDLVIDIEKVWESDWAHPDIYHYGATGAPRYWLKVNTWSGKSAYYPDRTANPTSVSWADFSTYSDEKIASSLANQLGMDTKSLLPLVAVAKTMISSRNVSYGELSGDWPPSDSTKKLLASLEDFGFAQWGIKNGLIFPYHDFNLTAPNLLAIGCTGALLGIISFAWTRISRRLDLNMKRSLKPVHLTVQHHFSEHPWVPEEIVNPRNSEEEDDGKHA